MTKNKAKQFGGIPKKGRRTLWFAREISVSRKKARRRRMGIVRRIFEAGFARAIS